MSKEKESQKFNAFVCPECGILDKDGDYLKEYWEELVRYSINPQDESYEQDEVVESEWSHTGCEKCYWNGSIPLKDLLVEVEPQGKKLVVEPIGDYWKKNLSKLKSVLEKSTGKTVTVKGLETEIALPQRESSNEPSL